MQQFPVRGLAMQRGWLWAVSVCLSSGCTQPVGPLRRFLQEPEYRRELLQNALLSHDNDYARLRLSRYGVATESGWLRLPVFSPATAIVPSDGSGASRDRASSIDIRVPAASEEDADERALQASLRSIGQRAFFHYPAQLVSGFEQVRHSPAMARDYGLWSGVIPTGESQLGGLLEVSLADGSRALATTCATCHAAAGDRQVITAGSANDVLDLGKLAVDSSGQVDGPQLHWGPGRIDTSSDGMDNPAAIPDLRSVLAQRFLHHDATLRNDLFALALRIETLLITTYREGVRPPIEVALGLAVYLWDLAPPSRSAIAATEGGSVFEEHCAGCHLPPHYAGDPVPLSVVATDSSLGVSTERGTGFYRTPSLLGAKLRRQFFHHGVLSSVRAVLDPERLRDSYREGRHGPGAVLGHRFGLELSVADRVALTAFVESL